MANEVFQCEFGRGLLKKISGNEKVLFLEITSSGISGKAIVYPEHTGNAYTSDIQYDFNAITKVEKIKYQGLDTFVVYVRSGTLYGLEKFQLRFPGMRDIAKATSMLRRLIEDNGGNPAMTKPVNAQAPAPKVAAPSVPAPGSAQEAEPVSQPAATPASKSFATLAEKEAPVDVSPEERLKQFEKLEAIYQTGMISEKEYKTGKAEFISSQNGLDDFYNKLKVNLQYSEIGFLSEQEFADYKSAAIEECSKFDNVSGDIYKKNLKKLLVLNLCEVLSDAEYKKTCDSIVQTVQYASDDSEDLVIEKIERWPILKECEIISSAQYDQLLKIVADDTKIKMGDSIPVLEHKLTRLTTLSKTFIFTPEEFAKKKQDFITDMTALDYSSEAKFKGQIERLMTLRRCDWLSAGEYEQKKKEVVQTVKDNNDAVEKMQLFGLLADVTFITQDEYDGFKQGVIDKIFSEYSDISELQKKAQTLMSLKEAGIISDAEFNDYKKKLLAL